MNKPAAVSYALKRDGSGERHGTAAERLLATQGQQKVQILPNRLFLDGPGTIPTGN